ncbi:uncharacterized protein LOC129740214 [Uranotaenia lowii]|uniref:uncharacterized protein LOC129740214 n=1 Tax=Uranotaenia lowii TaxID=190385 RepID=UPI002478756B|nr:uncharacterized protein LOC129740214 [Uranotaenia lowii]XP_055587803.1 uncharacterized protein LOC129740214 [Uranotaenia lowii]
MTKFLNLNADSSKIVKVKQESLPVDEIDPNPEPLQQEEPAQVVRQEDPGGSSILRIILLQCREPGRTSSTGSGELEPVPTKFEDTTKNQLPIETLEAELEVVPPQSSLLQQMLLHQGPNNHPNSSPSLLKRMLLEGGASDRQSPLEGSSTMNRRRSEDQIPIPSLDEHPDGELIFTSTCNRRCLPIAEAKSRELLPAGCVFNFIAEARCTDARKPMFLAPEYGSSYVCMECAAKTEV